MNISYMTEAEIYFYCPLVLAWKIQSGPVGYHWLMELLHYISFNFGCKQVTINLWRADSGQIPRSEGLYPRNWGIMIILLDLHQVYSMLIGWTTKKKKLISLFCGWKKLYWLADIKKAGFEHQNLTSLCGSFISAGQKHQLSVAVLVHQSVFPGQCTN